MRRARRSIPARVTANGARVMPARRMIFTKKREEKDWNLGW